jgi:hypothetical protein
MSRAGIITHWSLPPQHAGYWPRIGGGDGWPELGGAGPHAGPHIPGLVPGWHDIHAPQRTGLPVRPPRGAQTGWRAPQRQPRRGFFNAPRAARFR